MKKIIGIVGGVGPYAGLEFSKKIFDFTVAKTDQEHLEVVLISASSSINDRTQYLSNPDKVSNPAEGIFSVILRLQQVGAELIAVPCSTAHSSLIWDELMQKIENAGLNIKLIHMVEEVFVYLKTQQKNINKLGLLATKGTYMSRVYNQIAERNGFELLIPDSKTIDAVHSSIYDSNFGIKARSNPVSAKAVEILKSGSEGLIRQGAQGVILGCTEIPLAMKGIELSTPFFDPMDITASILVKLAQCE